MKCRGNVIFACIGVDEFFFHEKTFKCSNNYICAFIRVDIFMNALRCICTFCDQLKTIC